jgi:hypothetical protein
MRARTAEAGPAQVRSKRAWLSIAHSLARSSGDDARSGSNPEWTLPY